MLFYILGNGFLSLGNGSLWRPLEEARPIKLKPLPHNQAEEEGSPPPPLGRTVPVCWVQSSCEDGSRFDRPIVQQHYVTEEEETTFNPTTKANTFPLVRL